MATKPSMVATRPDVSLIRGGPFYHVQESTRLIRPDEWNLGRRIALVVAIGWTPLLLITVLFNTGAIMSFFRDYRIHARMLVAVPVLLLGQTLVESRFRVVVEHIRNARLLRDADLVRIDTLISSLRRLRDSALPELIILLLVLAHTALSFKTLVNLTPWLAYGTGTSVHLTPAGWYAVLVSASIFQFLVGLSLWKWLLWTLFAFKLSRLELKLIPSHADGHGGLGFLGLTPIGFTPTAFAATAVIAATWRHEILHGNAHLIDFKLPAIALVVIIAVFALLPLVFFVPRLAALRRKGILEYSVLGQIQSATFHEKWILGRADRESEFPAAEDSSTLCDFSSDYERIKQLRPLAIDRGALVTLAASIILPGLPAILAEIPVAVILKQLLSALR